VTEEKWSKSLIAHYHRILAMEGEEWWLRMQVTGKGLWMGKGKEDKKILTR